VFNLNISLDECRDIARERFTDKLFQKLGASRVISIDASDYEGATVIHDMNRNLPDGKITPVDFIYDGGSMEHIFNVPIMLRTVSQTLKIGGIYFGTCPANGEPGHGFYQFSPEFYYRSLRYHGFEVLRLYLSASQYPVRWYRVVDPSDIHCRVTFLSAEPIYCFVLARKVDSKPSGAIAPMQSDYESGNWKLNKDHLAFDHRFRAKVKRLLYRVLVLRLLWSLNVVARHVLLVGAAVWPTSPGISRVNIDADLRSLKDECCTSKAGGHEE
jgi:hypothetical protein